ncbi:hypothetical protein ALC60_10584 [Trachymyrmex zeteki]|uniref:Uncharacterized protein n=1 Tax=Mycetomoellerius zeteki TaxID=64791 RepID=A0A151WR40_9HYME|nr:hypothetical protein ALC60_10584 [Trachymyrmex zeteki]
MLRNVFIYFLGVECNFEILERNLFDHWTATCPRFFDKKDESWCCIDVEARKSYCCDLETFVQKTGVGVFLPLIIAGVHAAYLASAAAAVPGIAVVKALPMEVRYYIPFFVLIFLHFSLVANLLTVSETNLRYTWDLYVSVTQVFVADIQTPVVQVIQSPANIPPGYTSQPTQNIPTSYTSQPTQNYVPPYPMGSTAMPQPPPYTDEAYAKQAPYNPAYLPSQ